MADKLDLNYENDYEMSDSEEEEYTQRERNLLKKVRKGNKQNVESDEEILKFDSESDLDEPEKFEADSDLEETNERDGLPDTRSWGKKKSTFYNTDFHDNDYSTYNEKEEEIATYEQQEALEIQKRLASELNESDFNIDLFATSFQTEQQEEVQVNKTKTDLTDLSKKQKLALFKSEAPEFDGLVQDFSNRMAEYKDLLLPTIQLFKSIDFSNHPFIDFIKCRSELILNYSANISFYLMLKAKRVKVKNHPIVKRLVQFRQLICQLDDIFEYVIKPQIETLLAEFNNDDDNDVQKSNKLKILENLKLSTGNEINSIEKVEEIRSKPLFKKQDSDNENDEKNEDSVEELGGTKRQITRQIAKNKGLTATKRRELRNPRVKNKMKFNKAVKRRKGAVQPIRSKVDLYSGEATGIKTHLKRSVKIK